MEDLLTYIIVAIMAGWIGWNLRGIVLMAAIADNPKKFIKMLQQVADINDKEAEAEVGQDSTELAIERVNGTLYAYTKDTNQFIAQGPDLKSLLESAHKRFPHKEFFGTIDKNNPAKELA
jgi:hypothetical protein